MSENLLTEVRGSVAHVIFNRPEKLNALSFGLLEAFEQAIADFGADDSVSVIVISGAGGNFSVGYDVSPSGEGYTDLGAESGIWSDWESLRQSNQRWLKVWDTPKPVISAIEGHCMGGATQLSVCSDITIVSSTARIGWPSVPLGGGLLSPPSAWLIGPKKAKELSFIAGSGMSGEEAARRGWANEAVAEGTAVDCAQELAARIAQTPLDLLRLKKMALNRQYDLQGFRETFLMGAEWDAIAHTALGAQRTVASVHERGLKETIRRFKSGEGV